VDDLAEHELVARGVHCLMINLLVTEEPAVLILGQTVRDDVAAELEGSDCRTARRPRSGWRRRSSRSTNRSAEKMTAARVPMLIVSSRPSDVGTVFQFSVPLRTRIDFTS
jgi:hypothetical protein